MNVSGKKILGTALGDAATTAGVAALLALFWWLAVTASIEKSHTSDELPHIAAGYAFDRLGDFRMHPENGILPQRVFGLPALADGARLPVDETLWRRSTYWQVAWDFFYSNNNLTDWIVLRARALNALFGVGLGLLIFAMARARHGRSGGLLALAFFALAPNFLAHAGLATSDMAASFFLTLAPWLFWRHLERRDLASGLLAALVSGLALCAKFNGVLLAPIYFLLGCGDAWLRQAEGPAARRRFAANFALAVGQAGGAILVVWAFFNFRFHARGPGMPELESFAWSWSEMFAALGWKRAFVQLAVDWKLLPEAWLYGLTNVLAGETARPAFFAGVHSLHGWWQFFPTLFLVKTPLATLTALLLVLGGAVRFLLRLGPAERRDWVRGICPVAVTAGVIGGIAVASNLNIGDRHILAVYPALFVALGALATTRALAWLAPLLLLGLAVESFAIRPHYLASFNVVAGGPRNAYRLVADSSLDWGQDLPAVQHWLAAHRRPNEKLFLGYFGSAWPPHYGVRPNYFLPSRTLIVRPPLTVYDYEPGLYAVSATILDEVYAPDRGPWTPQREQNYRTLRAQAAEFSRTMRHGELPPNYEVYDRLRLARLCKYLQARPPEAYAGYSILIFRLTAEDLRAALDAPVTGTHRMRLP